MFSAFSRRDASAVCPLFHFIPQPLVICDNQILIIASRFCMIGKSKKHLTAREFQNGHSKRCFSYFSLFQPSCFWGAGPYKSFLLIQRSWIPGSATDFFGTVQHFFEQKDWDSTTVVLLESTVLSQSFWCGTKNVLLRYL